MEVSMADKLDLTGDIAEALNGAATRHHPVVLGYIAPNGNPALSFRGSAQVLGPEQLAVWSRKRDEGLAVEIAEKPDVSLLYYGGPDSPGPRLLSIRGRARVDPSVNDVVYENMIEPERTHDPDKAGVAVVIDVDLVQGFGDSGPFGMERGA
jgi:hypothetical protein